MATSSALANDKYRSSLRSTFVSGVDDTLEVTSVPLNVPTIVTVGWKTEFETVFRVENKSGDSAANYALTGAVRLKGYEGNLAEGLAVNCLNHEEYFNQWGDQIEEIQAIAEDAETIVQGGWTDLDDATTININLDEGVNRKFRVTLGGNRTFSVSNPLLGQVFILRVAQDGSGGRGVTWFSGISWQEGEAPDEAKTASTADVYGFIVTKVTGGVTFDGFVLGNEMKVVA